MIQTALQPEIVKELLHVIATLDDRALAEFEVGFEQIRLGRSVKGDKAAINIVARHRLPAHQEARVQELLFKNREGTLTGDEESELDQWMHVMDEALASTAEELILLAQHHQLNSN